MKDALREPMDQGQPNVKFNREPAIGSRNEPRPPNPHDLICHESLVLFRRHMLDDRIAVDDVQAVVSKRQSTSVHNDTSDRGQLGFDALEATQIQVTGNHMVEMWIPFKKLH